MVVQRPTLYYDKPSKHWTVIRENLKEGVQTCVPRADWV
jgi:hypothetical protein